MQRIVRTAKNKKSDPKAIHPICPPLSLPRQKPEERVWSKSRQHFYEANPCTTFTRQKTALYTDSNRFSFSNFKHFLTLFSKFFSSFPHGTCSLSVSRKYLALEGVYLPSLRFNPEKRDSSKAYCTRQTPDDERDSHPL